MCLSLGRQVGGGGRRVDLLRTPGEFLRVGGFLVSTRSLRPSDLTRSVSLGSGFTNTDCLLLLPGLKLDCYGKKDSR